ncbi:alternative ribosome rescue aminoacyl-tRNA hydrolase ArfB [Cucumibacter marinus]|uniref:alternative ribosome rescue aminoacyl-tRNA hydrolase ArfB n=1 Tax=Cucumibacter marinus TaxID=1121252 RepID=UPI00040CC092|nr:alternative ribosome rescue aminoacyl-tRNA hydrolase ArfB [Cucumibacter marinus]
MIAITDSVAIEDSELDFSFVRSSGPGGQNVNKVASAVQLRFDLMGSASLTRAVKERAARLAGSRLTKNGEIIIFAEQHRSQELNREDAVARLVALLSKAATPPKARKKTRPTLGSKKRRLEAKTKRGQIKKLRKGPSRFE